jgi:hypothetical protein
VEFLELFVVEVGVGSEHFESLDWFLPAVVDDKLSDLLAILDVNRMLVAWLLVQLVNIHLMEIDYVGVVF